MVVRVKFPTAHPDGQIVPTGAEADFPDNLAQMLIARGQAEAVTAAPGPAGAIKLPPGVKPANLN